MFLRLVFAILLLFLDKDACSAGFMYVRWLGRGVLEGWSLALVLMFWSFGMISEIRFCWVLHLVGRRCGV